MVWMPACGLTLDLPLILLSKLHDCFRFTLCRRFAQQSPLRFVEPLPGILVDENRHLGGIEAGVDSIFRFLVPSEVEYSGVMRTLVGGIAYLAVIMIEQRVLLPGHARDDRILTFKRE